MTDPNKAAVTESNAQFLARMVRPENDQAAWVAVDKPDLHRLIALAEERVMIEEHQLAVQPYESNLDNEDGTCWVVDQYWTNDEQPRSADLSTALRSVVAKIGEGK